MGKASTDGLYVKPEMLSRLNVHRAELARFEERENYFELSKHLASKEIEIAMIKQKKTEVEKEFNEYRKKVQLRCIAELGDEIQKQLKIEDLSQYNIDYVTGFVGKKEDT